MEGKTTQTKERIISNKMEFPSLMICTQNGYKEDALADIGLPVDILKIRSRPTEGNFEFDPESVWNKVTYSSNELNINWVFLLGKRQYLRSALGGERGYPNIDNKLISCMTETKTMGRKTGQKCHNVINLHLWS